MLTVLACEHEAQTPGAPDKIGFRVGNRAPEFTLPTRDGSQYSLSQSRGKIVLLNFWATWCGPCRMEMPSMQQLSQKLKAEDFEIIAISEDEGWTPVDHFAQQTGLTFRIVLDGNQKAAQAYNSYRFPETFILDRQGLIIDKRVGAVDWSHPSVEKYFRELLAKPK